MTMKIGRLNINLGKPKEEVGAISKAIAQSTAVPTVEVVARVTEFFATPLAGTANKYTWYQKMYTFDPEVAIGVDKVAQMVRQCYQGVTVDDIEKDDPKYSQVNTIVEALKLPTMFETVSKHLMKDGDDIWLIERQNGLPKLRRLPINTMTILESRDQLQKADAQIFNANYYVMNEFPVLTAKQQVFEASKILHFSVDNIGEEVYDLLNRYTFGVWSISPLESLRATVLWKFAAMTNDVLWRARNVPREHHKLDLTAFDPSKYVGTVDARVAAAKKAAEDALTAYASSVSNKAANQGYITGSEVDIQYIEPRSTTYTAPNNLMSQLDRTTIARIGIPESLGGGKSGTYATEIVLDVKAGLNALNMAEKIRDPLEKLLRNELIVRGWTEEEAAGVKIKIQLLLDTNYGETTRQVSVLANTGLLTQDELREMLGYDPLPPGETPMTPASRTGRSGETTQTPGDVENTESQRLPGDIREPITPQSRGDKQRT